MRKILIRTCKNQPSNPFAEASMNIVKLQNTHIATAPVNKRAVAICMETNRNRYRTCKKRCGSDKILIYII